MVVNRCEFCDGYGLFDGPRYAIASIVEELQDASDDRKD